MEQISLVQQLLVVLSGVIVGFSLGLIGGGGSILAVPLLLYVVGYHNPHVVIGTTALAVALTAFINLIPHWRAGNVLWKPAILFAIPGALGATLGAQIGKIFPGKELLFLFALLMIGVAVSMLRRNSSAQKPVREGRAMVVALVLVSFGVGLLSGFFGIGGGFLIVPGLIFTTGMPILNAVASYLVSVGAFGTMTAITYASAGLVHWLIAFEYIGGGVIGGLAGARLATHLGAKKKALSRLFAGVILVVAIYMLAVNITALHL